MDRELRNLTIWLCGLMACATLLALAGFALMEQALSDSLTRKEQALAGRMSESFPERREEIAAILSAPDLSTDVEAGRKPLAAYGLREGMRPSEQPLLSSDLQRFHWQAIILAWLIALPFCLVLVFSWRKNRRRVDRLALAAERVVEGDYSVRVSDGGEEGFDRLGHHFNQMSERLGEQVAGLKRDKIVLKDTLTDISHQMKTPLSSLMMYHELMEAEPDMAWPQRKVFLERGNTALRRMDWLIRQLLKMARLESGIVSFRSEQVSLESVVGDAGSALMVLAAERNVEIRITETPAGAVVVGDAEWLVEAVSNLVKNAVEHAPPGTEVGIAVTDTPLVCRISVVDHGAGFPAGMKKSLFERYHGAGSRVAAESTGIGLPLAHFVFRHHDGDLFVQDTPGGGATLVAVLPKQGGSELRQT